MMVPNYDPALSLSENLSRNGFEHRPSAIYGKREIIRLADGKVLGAMDDLQCEDWLKSRVAGRDT